MTPKIEFESTILAPFDKLSLMNLQEIHWLSLSMLMFGQTSRFIGLTIFEIPQLKNID